MSKSVLYHGSSLAFEKFDLINAGRGSRGPVGALGIWASASKETAALYVGEEEKAVYTISAPSDGVLKLPIDWLHDVGNQARIIDAKRGAEEALRFYDSIRSALLEEGYSQIAFSEAGRDPVDVVVLDPTTISILDVDLECIADEWQHVSASW